jgi:glycosyltransferase involved in cell wall biosynthesis
LIGVARTKRPRGVLFLQIADPAYYPPIMHAAALMAEAGWSVDLLCVPIAGSALVMADRAGITRHELAARATHVVDKVCYGSYAFAAVQLARRLRPDWLYASDPASCGPALLAAQMSGAKLVYHEHDTPDGAALNFVFERLRIRMLQRADVVVLPNSERARLVAETANGSRARLCTVWNVPQRDELLPLRRRRNGPLVIYYHGSITPERLPETVLAAVSRMGGRVTLRIAGYEAPGAAGYVRSLCDRAAAAGTPGLIDYLGAVQRRDDLLATAAGADVGLALMPRRSRDLNMRFMAGASNKPFDYMAAGLGLIVSDQPEWMEMFVRPGYARAVDPDSAGSIQAALQWFVDHPDERAAMAARARAKIAADWNYETAFAPVLKRLNDG